MMAFFLVSLSYPSLQRCSCPQMTDGKFVSLHADLPVGIPRAAVGGHGWFTLVGERTAKYVGLFLLLMKRPTVA